MNQTHKIDAGKTPRSVSQRGVRLHAVLVSGESLITRISPRKRTLQQNHFRLHLSWGPSPRWVGFREGNAKNSRDTAILRLLRFLSHIVNNCDFKICDLDFVFVYR